MDYIELILRLPNDQLLREIIIAELAEIGFESFMEESELLQAYIPASEFDFEAVNDLEFIKKNSTIVTLEHNLINDKNWNAVWESNYKPVIIPGKCAIRAPFHKPVPGLKFDIIIEPKMSFGTAHHETTAMMIELLFEINPTSMTVLDMGCGTGVLAILASKMGAIQVTAIDNDQWAYNNTKENIIKNNVSNVDVYLGDASTPGTKKYDLILANINRNILIADIPEYENCLNTGGTLLLSGFLTQDIPIIQENAQENGFEFRYSINKNNWAAVVLTKKAYNE
ncbi:MAG: 50S ribosomal protein L11 methyltransferase [Bacteroidales bacterium]|nr:50S ribosomal protein L11 methyltransferase [Bacteroidales bacterium]